MYWGKGMAMDLGTANTLIHKQGEGIVLNEPSVLAVNDLTGEIVAYGVKAKSYIGRTPENIRTARPLKDGVIRDFELAQSMIRQYLGRVSRRSVLSRPLVIFCVPSGITQVERRAVLDAAAQSGSGRILLMEELMAAAIGAGLDVSTPEGKLVMDIGGGTTEVALISMYSTLIKESLRVAGDELDLAIMRFLEEKHRLIIGCNHAEQIKLAIGTALPSGAPRSMQVHGKDRDEGIPRNVTLSDADVREALERPIKSMEELLRKVISALPPEFINDVGETGIVLAGGGALLPGLAERLEAVSGLKVKVDGEPLLTVVRGAGMALENVKQYKEVFIN